MARIKKEDIFYTLLKEFADKLVEGAQEYNQIIHAWPTSEAQVPQMKLHENKGDDATRLIMEQLYTAFVTPFDREDIAELALALDDIMDGMYASTDRLSLFHVDEVRVEAQQMAELTITATAAIKDMIYALPDYKKTDACMKHAIAIGHVEDQGDQVYRNALSRLFADEENGRTTVAWLRVFDRMEQTLDACDKAAGVVRNVVMKSA